MDIFDFALQHLGYGTEIKEKFLTFCAKTDQARTPSCDAPKLSYLGQLYRASFLLNQTEFHIQSDVNAKVLIVSDKFFGLAILIQFILDCLTNVSIVGIASNYDEAVTLSNEQDIQQLLFVGTPLSDKNYEILSDFRAKQVKTILVDFVDDYSYDLFRRYSMHGFYDWNHPINELIELIKKLEAF